MRTTRNTPHVKHKDVKRNLPSAICQSANLPSAICYALITVVLTYPIAFRLSSALAGFEGADSLQYLWSLWWFKKAVIALHTSPAHLGYLFYPTGGYHPVLDASAYVGSVSLPLLLVLDPTTVFNIQTLISFTLAGLAAYWLCLELTGDRRAAFLGGLIFAFFPSKSGHAVGCHLDLITVYWFPLCALFAIKLYKRPGLKYALLSGLSLALASLVSLTHVAYFTVPFAAAFTLWAWRSGRRRPLAPGFWPHLGLSGLVAVAVLAPFFWPLLTARLAGGPSLTGRGPGISADLLAFLLPSPFHPLLEGRELLPAFAHRIFVELPDLQEHVAYLGFVPLLLAAWGAWRRRAASRLWMALALGTAVLSLGNLLNVAGRTVTVTFGELQTYVLMPNALLSRLPFYALSRAPSRWNETTMLALAVLASLGMAAILKRRKGVTPLALVAALSLLIVVEYVVVFPFPMGEYRVPDFVRRMATSDDERAVLNVPIVERLASNRAMLYQTFHGRPIVGGYVLRYTHSDTGEPPLLTNFIAELMQPAPTPDIVDAPAPAQRRDFLRRLGIGWVMAYKPMLASGQKGAAFASLGLSPEEFQTATLSLLREALGQPVFEDAENAIFTVPPGDRPVERMVLLKEGKWYKPERGHVPPARWMRHSGTLMIYDPDGEEGSLRFTVAPYLWPRTLRVVVNGEPVAVFGVPAEQTYTTPSFRLQQGMNVVRFEAPAGCDRAVDLSAGSDGVARCLSFLFHRIEFVPGGAPLAQHPAPATLGDTVEFLGYDLETGSWELEAGTRDTERAIHLILYWRTIRHMKEDYTVFVHLVDSQGRVVAQGDHQPLDGAYPTPRWPTGGVVGYRARLPIPPDLPPGTYQLKLGMYLLATGQRLEVAGDESGENAVLLGPITAAGS